MIDGITYFRKNSPYPGDVTKNCALDGVEVDNNFFVLEGRDIKTLRVEGSDIVVELQNGKVMRSVDALKDVTDDVTDLKRTAISELEFDKESGVLKFVRNGEQVAITGFATESNIGSDTKPNAVVTVAVDDSLKGNGLAASPVSISPMFKTGQYEPVKKIISVVDGESLPSCKTLTVGDRYLTKEYVSVYGMLYNYEAVKKIACNLIKANSPWRIPTKEDWDDMLNAVEPCPKNKNHNSATSNKYLGAWAGKLLKSTDLWLHSTTIDHCGNDTCINYDTVSCGNCNNACESIYCGKVCDNECRCCDCGNCDNGCGCCDCGNCDNRGLDTFGFHIVPAGYADDGRNFVFFGERAYFWTATNSNCENVYVKRFEYNRNSVYQNIIAGQNYLSLRLVKDYNGHNYHESEKILSDQYPTVMMPSVKNGHSIWTSVNVSLGCGCGRIEPNNGLALAHTTKFYLNEWDGKEWLRNELKDGESVVIKKAPNGQTNAEYRLSDGKLINVAQITYEAVINDINPKLDELGTKIDNEINRSIAKDESFEDTINDELRPNITKNSNDIATVNTNLVSAIGNINEAIKTVNDNLVDAVNTINGGIATEIQERKDADKEIKDSLDQEIERATTKDNELTTAIAEEKQAREAKDADLENKIGQHQIVIDEHYQELKGLINTNKDSIDNLSTDLDATKTDLNNTKQVLTDFGKETAKAFEQINQVITDGFNTINGGIATEIQERKDADVAEKEARIATDEEIKATILTEEGTSFDTNSGVLTLKSKGGTNDIRVQFSMNFGEF